MPQLPTDAASAIAAAAKGWFVPHSRHCFKQSQQRLIYQIASAADFVFFRYKSPARWQACDGKVSAIGVAQKQTPGRFRRGLFDNGPKPTVLFSGVINLRAS